MSKNSKVFECPNCKAKSSVLPNMKKTTCKACGEVFELSSSEKPAETVEKPATPATPEKPIEPEKPKFDTW